MLDLITLQRFSFFFQVTVLPALASPPSVAYVAYAGLEILLIMETVTCLKSKACAYESRSHPDQPSMLHYV